MHGDACWCNYRTRPPQQQPQMGRVARQSTATRVRSSRLGRSRRRFASPPPLVLRRHHRSSPTCRGRCRRGRAASRTRTSTRPLRTSSSRRHCPLLDAVDSCGVVVVVIAVAVVVVDGFVDDYCCYYSPLLLSSSRCCLSSPAFWTMAMSCCCSIRMTIVAVCF